MKQLVQGVEQGVGVRGGRAMQEEQMSEDGARAGEG